MSSAIDYLLEMFMGKWVIPLVLLFISDEKSACIKMSKGEQKIRFGNKEYLYRVQWLSLMRCFVCNAILYFLWSRLPDEWLQLDKWDLWNTILNTILVLSVMLTHYVVLVISKRCLKKNLHGFPSLYENNNVLIEYNKYSVIFTSICFLATLWKIALNRILLSAESQSGLYILNFDMSSEVGCNIARSVFYVLIGCAIASVAYASIKLLANRETTDLFSIFVRTEGSNVENSNTHWYKNNSIDGKNDIQLIMKNGEAVKVNLYTEDLCVAEDSNIVVLHENTYTLYDMNCIERIEVDNKKGLHITITYHYGCERWVSI